MKRASERKLRGVARRVLKLETLERREVFAVGGLDPTFAYGFGKTVADFGGTGDYAQDSAFQVDGKIVVVGSTWAGGGSSNFGLARYNSDGSLDSTFGGFGGMGDGRVATDFASGEDYGKVVLIQADGKILVVGTTNPLGSEWSDVANIFDVEYAEHIHENRFAIARYNPDGTPDGSFGELGKVVLNRVGEYDNLDSLLGAFVQGDQLLLFAGDSDHSILTRINLSDGSLDVAFGSGGFVQFYSPFNIPKDVALHGDGIVAVGHTHSGELAFMRFSMNGSIDTSFGNDGLAVVGPGYDGALESVAVQADGSIVGAGYGLLDGERRFVAVRVLADGTPDASFNVDGVAEIVFPAGSLHDIAFGAGGSIVAAGYTGQSPNRNFAIARFGADGSVDQNFGSGGLVEVDFGNRNDTGNSVLTYANGKILITGSASGDFALTRIIGASVLTSPVGSLRPGGVIAQLDRPPTQGLWRPGFLLELIERIDQAIAEHRAATPVAQPTPHLHLSAPALRNNAVSRSNALHLLDELFAELADDSDARAGANANILNHPHQLSLRRA